MAPDDWKTAIENARDPLPMEAEIWAAGADIETAHFVARMLRQQGYYLVNPDQLGWDDINRFNAELHKGQSVYEDAGGCDMDWNAFKQYVVQTIREAEQAAYERAAKVAEQYNGYGPDGRCLTGYGATPFTAASDIAESIRALGKQEA